MTVFHYNANIHLGLNGCNSSETRTPFHYVGGGTIRLSGNTIVNGCEETLVHETVIETKFAEGEKVYICSKSNQCGVLEFIYIEKIYINSKAPGQYVIVYLDTTHRAWLEYELCSKQEAVELAILYNQMQLAYAQKITPKC